MVFILTMHYGLVMIQKSNEQTVWKQYDDTYKSFAAPYIPYPLTDIGIENFDPYKYLRKRNNKKPAPLRIIDFKGLIQHLPVQQQSFTTGIHRWREHFNKHGKLASIFGKNLVVEISRADIFSAVKDGDLEKVLFLTILWGYPIGMRGGYHENIFKNKQAVIGYMEEAIERDMIYPWEDYWFAANQVCGLGVSLLSKLLYFCSANIDGVPALIIDKKIIGTIKSNRFKEFENFGYISYNRASLRYAEYIDAVCDIAEKLEVEPAQVEMFLSEYGQHVK